MTKKKTFLFSFLILAIDQLIKLLVRENMHIGERIDVLPNFFALNYVENTGIAFSLFDNFPELLTVAISIILLVFLFYVYKLEAPHLSYIFFIGGGLGNLADRLTVGAVTDYIKTLFIDFPVFNFADICLNIGVGLMLLTLVFKLKGLGNFSEEKDA